MRVGLIADIHANLPALEAVVDDMPSTDEIICAGDIVGYNPWPKECLELVQDISSLVVQGNHDRNVDRPARYSHNEMARAGLELAQAELSESQQEWLDELPPRTAFANGAYRLAHSHPDPEHLGTYVHPPQFPDMRPYLDEYDGLILGHTHQPQKAEIDGRFVVNPGSVGQPCDGESTAAYAILDTDSSEVELRRVAYDIAKVITQVEESGLPTKTGTRLLDGT